jgi:hypothetical protein
MSRATWGNAVRIKSEAGPDMRPGSLASVCGMTEVKTRVLAEALGCAIGTTVFTVEFEDGSSIEIPEALLEVVLE